MAMKQPRDTRHARPAAPRPRGRVWARLHFLVRLLGLTALLALCVGLVLAQHEGLLASGQSALDSFWAALRGQPASPSAYLVAGSAGVILLALLVEALAALRRAAARRGAYAFNSLLQAGLAAVLLVAVNLFSAGFDVPVPGPLRKLLGERLSSPGHYARLDWTRDRQFTLPAGTRAELARLADTTRIVVYQRHKTFGVLSAKPDRYDYAAERKVVEKVRDLVEQFRELGARFDVQVLDIDDEGYDDKLSALTRDSPELRRAIEQAPENSIFFHARRGGGPGGGRELVQRLSFNEFYRLDKTASQEANGGRGNLVLLAQGEPSARGVGPVAERVLNLDRRRPRVGIAVIHELLTTRGNEAYGLRGLRKALELHGFDVRDVVLRQWTGRGLPPAAAATYEESKLDRLDRRLHVLKQVLEDQDRAIKQLGARDRDHPLLPVLKQLRDNNDKERKQREKEREALEADDALLEQKRMSDLRGKLAQLLADCDLLLVLRPSLFDVTQRTGKNLPVWLHKLEDEQFAAVREFVKSGKPLLVCVGPPGDPPGTGEPPGEFARPDGLEDFLAKMGIRLGKQAVLFDAENEALAEAGGNLLMSASAEVQVPPLLFDWPAGAGYPDPFRSDYARAFAGKPNRLRESLRLAARGLGRDQTLELGLRHPRPIYYEVSPNRPAPKQDPTFLMTSPDSWNEARPYPDDDYTPTFKPTGPDDPDRGTLDERRRGPFPVGVAVEGPPPEAWYGPGESKPRSVRVAVVGQSWFLVGDELGPARERLALDTCNWLLGRADTLPRADQPWSYPRVEVSRPDLWLWGTRLGLPVLFAYFGAVVLLARQVR